MKTNLTKMKVSLLSTVFVLFGLLTKSNAETIYTDDFSYQTNWVLSASGGSASFGNNAINLIGGSLSGSNAGRKSTLPAATFVSDSIAVQFEFFSSSLGFQIQFGTTPNRIQILKEGGLSTQLRYAGEGTSLTTNGAKVVTTTASSWHTMLVKYKKTATATTATFILDNGASTQVVDLSLQPAGYDFKLDAFNILAIGSTTVENVYIRNISIIGTKLNYPLLYSDNFTHKSNWTPGNAAKGTLQFVQDPDNTANNILQIADTTVLATDYLTSSKLPVFNFTGSDYLITYKFKTKINKAYASFGTTPKRLQLNAENNVSRPYLLRFSGEVTQSTNGSQFLDKATFDEWHTVDIKYNTSAKTAQLTVDGDKASVVSVTADLNLQPTPYDFVLDNVSFRTGAGNVMQIKELKVYGIGTASYNLSLDTLQATTKTASSFILNWKASTDVNVVGYDVYKDGIYYGSTTSATTMVISGLSNGTNYSMTVKSKDTGGNILGTSAALVVTTLDNQVPTAPNNLQNSIPTTTSFTLSWAAATDNVGVTAYDIYKDDFLYGTTTSTSLSIIGLITTTSYSLTVKAKDAAGNVSAASTPLVVVTADNIVPSAPTGLQNTTPTATGFTLSWTASIDNVAVTMYDVYKNGVLFGSTASTTFAFTGLINATAYSITIKAKDAIGNTSVASSTLVVTTADNSAPSTPTNLQNTTPTTDSFTLSWAASTDNVAVTGYDVYKDGLLYGSTNATSLMINGLSAATAYSMTVKAKDAAGNVSLASTSKLITTLDSIAPTAPTNLQATIPEAVTNFFFTLSWTASTDNVGVVKYNIYKDGLLCGSSTTTKYNSIYLLTASSSYLFTVKAVDSIGNMSPASTPLIVATRFLPIKIGMVGITNDNKNRIVWNKPVTTGISSFYIYRESNVMNVYEKIGTVPYDSLSIFVDSQSAPEAQSYKYKISICGSTGLESDRSSYHKTMHLSISKVIGTAWYLIWEPYEGFEVPTYNIYRGTTLSNLTLIASISGSNTQYTDLSAPSGNVYYQLEVVNPNVVNPTKIIGSEQKILSSENSVLQSYNSARSNIASYIISSVSTSNVVSFEVYPNPSNGQVILSLANANGYSVVVSNSLGQKVYLSKLLTEKTSLDFSQFGKQGIYFVQITDEKGSVVGRKKVVVQ